MKVLVTKANSDYWYKIKSFNMIEDIQQFIKECHCGIIIERNPYTNDIPTIKQCSLHIIIYNGYVE